MNLTRTARFRLNCFYYLCHVLLLLPVMGVFAVQDGLYRSALQFSWLTLTFLTYPCVYLLPGFAVSSLLLLSGRRWMVRTGIAWSWLYTSLLHLVLFVDMMLLVRMGFHINGLIINLLVTPGGFEAIGFDSATLVPVGIGVFLFLAAMTGLAYAVWSGRRWSVWLSERRWLGARWTGLAMLVLGVLLLVSMGITAYADMWRDKEIMIGMNNYPVCMKMRMRSFFKRMGVKRVAREEKLFSKTLTDVGELNYPDNPVTRDLSHKRMNVVWIVCESLRWDMLTAERMPNLWAYAQKQQRFLRHYSGGHGTRPAMFSMFYGLYGNNWDSFLYSHRGPLLIDWMHEDGYSMLCQTSAHFTYPEFDQTIFATVSKKDLVEQDHHQAPWVRDIALTDRMLSFIKACRQADKPFFTFGFFEATHAPYSFDPEHTMTDDYLRQVNFALVGASDGPALLNRMANAAYGIDRQVGRILSLIDSDPELRDHTIVLFTGDHGEEFFEKGHLGHNSTFVEEQIRVPLVLGIPGLKPACHEMMTNHVDFVATLAPFFGVTSPASDYTVGMNLLSPDYQRGHAIICGWNIETLKTPEFKYIIPQGNGMTFIGRNYFVGDDVETELPDDFMSRHAKLLVRIQSEMTRFVRDPD